MIDYPRFPHRGFMVDTSRHYLSMNVLFQTLDLMEINKMNVFHWHIVDNQAFPYQSTTFPNLRLVAVSEKRRSFRTYFQPLIRSEKGAYDPKTHIYTQQDVKAIIDYASARGIRAIPEFDTPGHTQSWERGHPGLLSPCHDDEGKLMEGVFRPMDPSKESVFTFLTLFYKEIAAVFPEEYVAVGGDEVAINCW